MIRMQKRLVPVNILHHLQMFTRGLMVFKVCSQSANPWLAAEGMLESPFHTGLTGLSGAKFYFAWHKTDQGMLFLSILSAPLTALLGTED